MITTRALANLERMKEKIPLWIKDALLENADFIINILQENQLAKGKDSSGTIVGRYSWATDVFYAKDPQNKPRRSKTAGDPYNFEWSGELFDSMNIKISTQESSFDIYSTTGKDVYLEDKFKRNLTKLTKENNDWVNENILEPYVAKKMVENMFLFY